MLACFYVYGFKTIVSKVVVYGFSFLNYVRTEDRDLLSIKILYCF